jgi:predicted transcriptional regulator
MNKVIVKTGAEADFFKRGRKLAQLADRGERLPKEVVVTFEDPEDMLRLMTPARMTLFKAIKEKPGSIASISERLRRDRSAVTRDISALLRVGILRVESRKLPGHGRMKEVSVAAGRIKLEARVS